MKIMLSAVTGLTATALAAGTAFGPAGTAHADGPGTDPAVHRAIQAQRWVELKAGDRGYRVASVRCFLTQFGAYDNCAPTAARGDVFLADMVQPVKRYQAGHGLTATGTITPRTWEAISKDAGITRQGDRRVHQVKAVQAAMRKLQDSTLSVDGKYGPKTTRTVTSFQRRKRIGADGIFGPLTFHAAFGAGAENKGTPGF
ncbi:peptidoglycan-binding protein [Actinomadura graeca]|uniref:Peptidoglycan-binding protein n=1 Tax=Actinomadura graeca TaxID=2750812 RepID=A0ABX8QQB9_9ACTN|nr:peptidoglycan-binding domain-containing protein [Actinomadura graeca]QXJ20896.1 peptidoglycan-binding protein [Actinomadura graeca]